MSEPADERGRGRPSLYSEALAAEICERLSEGETLADICRSDHMPAVRTVSDWKAQHVEFSAAFGRAREVGFDAIAARARRTARGHAEEEFGDSSGDVARDKLIIETDLKLLAKWDPRRYGDKHLVVGGGPDDDPVRMHMDLSKLSDDELALMHKLLARAGGAEAEPADT